MPALTSGIAEPINSRLRLTATEDSPTQQYFGSMSELPKSRYIDFILVSLSPIERLRGRSMSAMRRLLNLQLIQRAVVVGRVHRLERDQNHAALSFADRPWAMQAHPWRTQASKERSSYRGMHHSRLSPAGVPPSTPTFRTLTFSCSIGHISRSTK